MNIFFKKKILPEKSLRNSYSIPCLVNLGHFNPYNSPLVVRIIRLQLKRGGKEERRTSPRVERRKMGQKMVSADTHTPKKVFPSKKYFYPDEKIILSLHGVRSGKSGLVYAFLRGNLNGLLNYTNDIYRYYGTTVLFAVYVPLLIFAF